MEACLVLKDRKSEEYKTDEQGVKNAEAGTTKDYKLFFSNQR